MLSAFYTSMLNTVVSRQVHVTKCVTFVMGDGFVATGDYEVT